VKKKIISLLLVLGLLLCSLTLGCSSKTVMTVGGYKVSEDLLRYFVLNYKNGYDEIDPSEFSNNAELKERLYENTIDSLKEMIVYERLAKHHGISLTSSEKKEVKAQVAAVAENYLTDAEYKAALKKNFMTEDVLYEVYRINALCDKLYNYLTDEYTGIFRYDDATVQKEIDDGNFFSAQHILLIFNSEKEKTEVRAAIEAIKARLEAGESMLSVYEDIKSDYGSEELYFETYDIFTYTEMNKTFEDALIKTEIGAYSDIVEYDDGYQIIKRMPVSDDYVDKNFDTVVAKYLSRVFFNYVDEYKATLEVKLSEKYASKDFSVIE